MTADGRHYGTYRGTVAANTDPDSRGRVQITCPSVLGDGRSSWAEPSLPYAGKGVGLFLVPPVGPDVWVVFENGDPDRPIVTGCFWSQDADVPASPASATTKMLRTDGLTLTVDDTPGSGGVTIEVSSPVVNSPLRISLTASGIELSNGASKVLLGSASVSVNDGALEVT